MSTIFFFFPRSWRNVEIHKWKHIGLEKPRNKDSIGALISDVWCDATFNAISRECDWICAQGECLLVISKLDSLFPICLPYRIETRWIFQVASHVLGLPATHIPAALLTKVNNRELEEVDHFKCLGSVLTRDGYCTREIKMRIAIAKEAFGKIVSHIPIMSN